MAITTDDLKNLKDGETIETPRGTFKIERFCFQINLYRDGKLVSRDYLRKNEKILKSGFTKNPDFLIFYL